MNKFSKKDIGAIKVGLVSAAAIIVVVVALDFFEHWRQVRRQLDTKSAQMKEMAAKGERYEQLVSRVPVFEIPQDESVQRYVFREKFTEQLKKAGIKNEPLQGFTSRSVKGMPGYKLLSLKVKGTGQFNQVMDLLSNLYANPYLVAVEQFEVKCDPKNRQKSEVELKVSTLAR